MKYSEFKLGECIDKVVDNRGKTPPLSQNGIPLIETTSIVGQGKYPNYNLVTKFVSEDTYKTWFRNGHPISGDVLIATVGANMGNVSLMNDKHGCVAQNLVGLRTKSNVLYSQYLYYLLFYNKTQEYLKSLNIGSAQPNLKVPHLLNMTINLPNIEKQKAIANILAYLDSKIEINAQINNNLQSLSQLLFKHWFIDFEFPNEEGLSYKSSGGEMVDSELGMIPKGWKVKTIQDICTIKRGASPRPIQAFMDDTKQGIPWIKISDATSINTPFLLGTKEYIKPEGKSKSVFIKEGTLIVSNSATPGIPKFIQFKACVHDGWLILDKYDSNYRCFIYFLILSLRKNLVNLSNGSVFNNLKTDIVKTYKFINPSKEVLRKYEEIVGSLMNRILHNSKENKNLSELRDTLLPKLMNGEINLENIEI